MIEINSESKAKFFAQYLKQPVYVNKNWNKFDESVAHLDCTYLQTGSNGLMEGFLLLKPLSFISYDEDVIKDLIDNFINRIAIKFISPTDQVKLILSKISFSINTDKWDLEMYQYLQSKGYALPWMGLSVDKMVEAGWIKLQEA